MKNPVSFKLQTAVLVFVGFVLFSVSCSEDDSVPGHTHNAADINVGTLSNARLSMGTGGGIDADLLDGQEGAAFAQASHVHDASEITTGTIDNARLNMGPGNGLDADTLDGYGATAFVMKSGDVMAGSLDMGVNTLDNAIIGPGPSTATTSNEGLLKYDSTAKAMQFSDGSAWTTLKNVSRPIMWSGGSSTSGQSLGAAGWYTYPTDVQKINTAAGYLTVATNGVFTVNTAGYYKIIAWSKARSSTNTQILVLKNASRIANQGNYSGNQWTTESVDVVWSFSAGDTIRVDYYFSGQATDYAYYHQAAAESQIQVIFMGPL